jgi:TolB-like protein/DNA-binding winged helix-turn-helix (wHTH) protein
MIQDWRVGCYTSGREGSIPMAVRSFQFGEFKLDCDRFELRRGERTLKLERKPMELLILLAAKNGDLVTRAEIVEKLWDSEVFVDTEHGINTAVRKIRQVLRDDSVQPRFVQTVTGKGYRFAAPIVEVRSPVGGEVGQVPPEVAATLPGDVIPIEGVADVPIAAAVSRKSRYWLAVAAVVAFLVVGISLGARGLRDRAAMPKISSLAVLPLDNLSGDPSQDYFADGMTDELTTMLAKNSNLRVVSRTSVMQYKGVHRPLPEIARELGVDGVLEGSVERNGDKVHMTIQLIQAPSDTHVWAESYDREASDVVSLPREAAQTIAKKLNSAVAQSTQVRYVSPEAHDDYLRGRYLWFADKNDEAGKYFKKVTELQPDYALGWAGLAMYYGQGVLDGQLDPVDSSAAGEEAAHKAVELDDSLPEAHLTFGAMIFINRWDWVRADQEIARAIELDPKYAEAYNFRAKIYVAIGRYEEAIEAQKKAQELAPFQRPYALGLVYVEARQYDAAIKDVLQRYETLPDSAGLHWILRESYRCKGMLNEAAQEWEKIYLISGDKELAANIRRTFEKGGYNALLLRQIKIFKQRKYVSPVDLALQYAQLGDKEKTLSLLEEGYRQHSPVLLWIRNDPAFDFVHGDERYRAIVRGIGLPPMTSS